MGVARNVLRTLCFAPEGEARSVMYECRRCGLTLDDDESPCPSCGTDDVARFSL